MAQNLLERAQEAPKRVGLIFEDGREWSWREWYEESARYAAAVGHFGVKKGDRVALFLQNSPELTFLLFGVWQIGAVPVAISSLYNATELAECLKKTSPVLLVTTPEQLGLVPKDTRVALIGGGGESAPDLRMLSRLTEPLQRPVDVAPDADGVILFTGGSTGLPKPVISTPSGVFKAMSTLATASKGGKDGPYPLASESVSPNLLCWPLFHGGGQHSMMFAIYVGRSVLLMERFRVEKLVELVNQYEIDNLFLLPTMMYDLVRHEGNIDLSSVRKVLTAGQTLDPSLRAEFEDRFGVPILSNYGSTETGHVAGWSSRDLREGKWKPGAAGKIYEGVEVEIRDDDMNVSPPGTHGELWIRTSMSKGYAGSDENSEVLVVDGWVRTGDVGWIDEDGVLFLAGRKRDLIKTGGYQVWPGELERELRLHPGVADVVVTGVPDERYGEIPKAYVVPRPNVAISRKEIVDFSRERLAHFKQIRDVAFVESLPRSDAGKIQRHDLEKITTIKEKKYEEE